MTNWQKVEAGELRLEQAPKILELLLKELGLRLEVSEGFWGQDFRLAKDDAALPKGDA